MAGRRLTVIEDGPRGRGGLLLAIDESVVPDPGGHRHSYVIASVVVIADERDQVRHEARQAIAMASGLPRRRPFHWRKEGGDIRKSMLEAVASRAEAAIVAAARGVPPRQLEAARATCLGSAFDLCLGAGLSPDEIIIESRERETKPVGQNRLDYAAILDARRRGALPPKVAYGWAGKDEPILWLADAVAGAHGDALLGGVELAARATGLRVITQTDDWARRA